MQTLQNFTEILPEKKGIEKSLWVKKFIKRLDYSREEIALLLYYKGIENADFKISTGSQVDENVSRNLKMSNSEKNISAPDFSLNNSKWLRNMDFNRTISIILPNTIHACRKKNL